MNTSVRLAQATMAQTLRQTQLHVQCRPYLERKTKTRFFLLHIIFFTKLKSEEMCLQSAAEDV